MSNDTTDSERTVSTELPEQIPGDQEEKQDQTVSVDNYTWREFMREHGHGDEVELLYQDVGSKQKWSELLPFTDGNGTAVPRGEDWERVEFDPASYLGYPIDAFEHKLDQTTASGAEFHREFKQWVETTAVSKDAYTWEHFKWEYYYDDEGEPPRTETGEVEPFEPEEHLGFEPETIESVLRSGADKAANLRQLEEERTVNVNPELDEDEFFSTVQGQTTVVNRYDLEKAVSMSKKKHFVEEERYWVDKPYAFIIIFHSIKENERKYYVVDPYLNEIEEGLIDFFSGKLRTSIKYSDDDVVVRGTDSDRAELLEAETKWLMDRYDIWNPGVQTNRWDGGGLISGLQAFRNGNIKEELKQLSRLSNGTEESSDEPAELDGIMARPEPAVLEEDLGWLTDYQVEKLLYMIRREFIGYERIDPIKHDINVEDISCDGYNSPVFIYHTDYENLITNVEHNENQLDNFVIKLAQRSGKGISKRQPQVDATLPDGSRAQLTLGKEVSDHGTNYTIRQFKDVPFTPVDLINWHTFSLDEMAFLWLCIESNKSLIFAGGTASGKTTSLNAVSLFIPSNAKIVSIEDTREVELPQRNWVASVTRPSFSQDNTGDVDEFDLLEAALRQRPDYIVMGEVRGEEGRTLFQVMSTGHTTYTTFHADTVDEVLKRFTTDPINVSKTLFTALDLISVQTQTKVQGQKVRRNKTITEINSYDAKNDEVRVQDVYQWQPEQDEFHQHGASKKLEQIAFDRGWTQEELRSELFKRRAILAYLITNGLNKYTEVAATLQAFINDPETILSLIANQQLESCLEDLRGMESVLIDVDPAKEALVPRPEPDSKTLTEAERILEQAEERIFEEYQGAEVGSLVDALSQTTRAEDITAMSGTGNQILASITEQTASQLQNEQTLSDATADSDDERTADSDEVDNSAEHPAETDIDTEE